MSKNGHKVRIGKLSEFRPQFANATIICACGCGGELLRFSSDSKRRERRFIHGHNAEVKKVKGACDHCEASIEIYAYMLKKQAKQFCNQSCASAFQRTAPTVECVVCKSPFRVARVRVGSALYCSMACKRSRERVTRACAQCGAEVTRHRSVMAGERIYCGKACQHLYQSIHCRGSQHPRWFNGRALDRGQSWPAQRKLALERDGYACRKCSTTESLDVHHLKPARCFVDSDEANALGNLLTVCDRCHPVAEKESRRLYPVPIQARKAA